MKLTLPLPPKALHPNARVHWKAKLKPKAKARGEAALVASTAPDKPPKPWAKARVRPTFYLPRRQDLDNLGAWCKAYYDGISDAGVVANDSGLIPLTAIQITGKGLDYRVELDITEDKGDA